MAKLVAGALLAYLDYVDVLEVFRGRGWGNDIQNANNLNRTHEQRLRITPPKQEGHTFSWEKFFINLISLKIRFASMGSSKALETFLIATFCPLSLSIAEMTTPYAPCPMGRIKEYLL